MPNFILGILLFFIDTPVFRQKLRSYILYHFFDNIASNNLRHFLFA